MSLVYIAYIYEPIHGLEGWTVEQRTYGTPGKCKAFLQCVFAYVSAGWFLD